MGLNRSNLEPAGFFVARTTALPAAELRAWTGDGERTGVRARLRDLVLRPEVAEAIYVASPSLHRRTAKAFEESDAKEAAKVEGALARYVARMTGRATPFGLFAGFGVGRIGETTALARGAARRHVRLDSRWLAELAKVLERRPEIRARLRLAPAASLYEVGGRLHYPVAEGEGTKRTYAIVALDADDALRAALRRAEGGATRAEIARAITSDDALVADAESFVDELLDEGVLESTLRPALTGSGGLRSLIDSLAASGDEAATGELRELERAIADLEREPPGCGSARYDEVAARARRLVPALASDEEPLQVDSSHEGEMTLGAADVEEIARAIGILHALAPADDALADFANAFARRYEGRRVPLMEALDEELGIGFAHAAAPMTEPTPLLRGLALPRSPGGRPSEGAARPRSPWSRLSPLLLAKLERAWASGAQTIDLADDEVPAPSAPLPRSVAALVSLVGGREGERRVLVHGYSGASAARLVARHAAWAPDLADALRAHLRDEEAADPDAIFAEVVHVPAGSRVGNVLARPVLRAHEIAFCARGSAPRSIALADLTVSVEDGRVVLRSISLDREIVPRLSTAHAYGSAKQLGLYRFLGALQARGAAAAGAFSWGVFEDARFLPRVTSGRVILSPRRWGLDEREIRGFCEATGDARVASAKRLRSERGLPRVVGLGDHEEVLAIDLDNPLLLDALARELEGATRASLVELFHDEAELVMTGPGGGHVSELVVPFLAAPRGAERATPAPAPPRAPSTIRRSFPPGSEWLTAKIYVAASARDRLLRDCLGAFLAETAADRWFFLRFADPEPHVRLRLHGAPAHLYGTELPRLEGALAPWLADGRAERFELATYEREVERYGGDRGVELCEEIFTADSRAALALLGLPERDEGGRDRWAIALLGMDRLFADFGYDVAARAALTAEGRRLLARELGVSSEVEHAIAARYREEQAFVRALLEDETSLAPARAIFAERSAALAPVVRRLREAPLDARREALVMALVHMAHNRLLRGSARSQELVLHTFAAKAYASIVARKAAR